jgi:17beta-estradiol 17-dehydrogenase/3beta-hydroxysteroid 3-dehydrogenase/mitotic-spindle organizing protein 1
MRNLFAVTIGEKVNFLSIKAKERLMKLSCDTSLKIRFEALSLSEFWIYIKIEHLELSQLATEVLLLFGTTYLCEKTFSAMTAIKSEYRNRLQLESDLRVAVSTTQPRMSHLVSNMQAQPSH